ncbi:MAG: tyrosine-type recombinase/integrase [Bradyrhizobium sp.]|nr:tyrosine-type recombinase/integrase [Bradyrhizobium sp.]
MAVPIEIPKMKPMTRSLPLELWPEADQRAWAIACQPSKRLKRGGAAGHLRPVTRDDHAYHYGNFLGFLDRSGLLRHDGAAAANVTAENVDAYLAEIKRRVSPMTVHCSICKLRRAAKYMAPERDFGWLLEIGKDLALVAVPRSKFDRLVLTEVLLEAGLTLIQEAENSPNMTKLAGANQARNGLMLALLALCPIRRKNFVALEIGRSLVKIRNTWWIMLSADETKERRADERPINELLTPIIDRYISHHRQVVARSHRASSILWLSSRKGTPLSDKAVAVVIRQSTRSTVGVAVSPHLFRTSAASSAAILSGENPNLGSALLHHAHPSVTTAHYNRATSLRAGEDFRKIVRQHQKR